jgi:hypothetical protein
MSQEECAVLKSHKESCEKRNKQQQIDDDANLTNALTVARETAIINKLQTQKEKMLMAYNQLSNAQFQSEKRRDAAIAHQSSGGGAAYVSETTCDKSVASDHPNLAKKEKTMAQLQKAKEYQQTYYAKKKQTKLQEDTIQPVAKKEKPHVDWRNRLECNAYYRERYAKKKQQTKLREDTIQQLSISVIACLDFIDSVVTPSASQHLDL